MFRVEGRLILDGITIMDESANPSDGDESQNAPAIEVFSPTSDHRRGELVLHGSFIGSFIGSEIQPYRGVAIEVSGGNVHIDEESRLYSDVPSDKGVITAKSSNVYVYGSVFGNPEDDGYEVYTLYDGVVNRSNGLGLTIYVQGMMSEIDVRLGVPDGSMDHSLWIKYGGSDQQVVSKEIIDITLQDGFPLGTSIVSSQVGADVVCSEVGFGWSHYGDYSYCYLITPCPRGTHHIRRWR